VTATTRADFAASERRVVGDMSTDIVRGMSVAGFIVGVAVAALVAYASTLAQSRDFAVLRAIGLRGRYAIRLVLAQIFLLVAGGVLVALVLLATLAVTLPQLSASMVLVVRAEDVLLALLLATAVATLAALLPVLRVAQLDPASVYRDASR
jgi:putative ABC transport system permease protein